MTRQAAHFCRTAWTQAQGFAAVALCVGTAMMVPAALIAIGIQTA